jgi:outer membrane receptor protein involved in Fe transport
MLGPNMNRLLLIVALKSLILTFAIALPSAAQPNPADAPPQPAEIPGEERAAADDVVVVTASRREELLLNAPATMTVLTEDAISRAAVASVTDLLRLVPGLNTVQVSARDVNVTSRAATGTLADSLLVLLDGRSIYQDFFGFVAWDFLPIDTREIKQIEVIRGPASAVWGANAMTGVINIIAKTPREMVGNTLAIRFGQFDRSSPGGSFDGGGIFSISATHAHATTDRFAYKISAGLLTQEPFLRPTGNVPGATTPYPAFLNRGTTQPRLDARVDYDLADRRQKLIVAGGIAGTEGIIHTGLGPLDVRRGTTFKYGRVTYTRDKLKLQLFVNALDGESPPLLRFGPEGRPLDFRFENQAYDVEFSNLHLFGARHLISYGGNYRHNRFDLSFAGQGGTRNEGGAYVQDQIFLSERFRWIVGVRVDRFDVLQKAVLSPRTALLFKPLPSQTFRVSFNQAFRAPSFVNTFLDTGFSTQVDLGAGTPFTFTTVAQGNAGLKEAALTAYEVGYIGDFGRVLASAAFYLNNTKNRIQFSPPEYYTSRLPPVGWPGPVSLLDELIAQGRGLPARFTYLNHQRISDHGMELSGELGVGAGLSAFANYTWQADPRASGFDISELNLPPTHRVNVGLSVTHGRYFASLSSSFVDRQFWEDVGVTGTTPAYALVDGGFGVQSTDGTMAVAVRATNIFNKPVQQHVFGDVIRRTVTGEVRFGF